jgi:SAM-dependent methyltransferase
MARSTKRKGNRANTLPAEYADRHLLYQWSVQAPEYEVRFMDRIFQERRGRQALTMREDFCGTAFLSAAWVKSDPQRTALGLDLDGPTLQWGRQHNLAPLGADVTRVTLRQQDVRTVTTPPSDVACAFNFSFFLLHPMPELVAYFIKVRESLKPDGLFFLDCYGGWDAQQRVTEPRLVEVDEGIFTYTWHQESYNPIDNTTRCHIHFELAGGVKMRRAFTYDWRLYTPAEICDALKAAGFAKTIVYWDISEDEDEDIYEVTESAENQPGWLAYLVGEV